MPASQRDWFRRTTWTAADQAEFAARLGRSRTTFHKAQYLRIQALHLEKDANPPLIEAALELLDQLLKDFPDPSQLPSAYEQRARCLATVGRPDEAIRAHQQALEAERQNRGIRGHTYLDFAELVLTLRRKELYQEVLELVVSRGSTEPFPVAQYRAFTSAAFLCDEVGRSSDARDFATRALAAAGKTESPFRHHRTLGLVETHQPDVHARLWKLAKAG